MDLLLDMPLQLRIKLDEDVDLNYVTLLLEHYNNNDAQSSLSYLVSVFKCYSTLHSELILPDCTYSVL